MAVMKLDRSASEVFLEQAIKEGRATRQELSIKSIVIDHDLQSRVEMDMDHVKRLASFMDTGIDLRPVVVFRQEKPFKQWLSDGFHRVAAHKARRSQSIVAWVILSEDAKREALLYSVSANIENSKPTTAEDRKKSVFMLLKDEEYRNLSIIEISSRCGVSRPSVSKWKAQFFEEIGLKLPDEVKCEWNGKLSKRARSVLNVKPPRYYVAPSVSPTQKPSAYLCHRQTRIYLGRDSDEAREKFEVLKKEFEETERTEASKKVALISNGNFVQ